MEKKRLFIAHNVEENAENGMVNHLSMLYPDVINAEKGSFITLILEKRK